MIIHSHIPKRKKRKPNAKSRALQASWEDILRKYDVKPRNDNARPSVPVRKGSTDLYPTPIGRVSSRHIGSVDSGIGSTAKKASPKYTGDAMIGIGQLHKSNAVPIFKAEDAIDISKMRRG
jgi:hypothetical protein